MASKSFIRGLLDDPEDPQLPQYNPQGGWDTAANFGRMAAGMTTPGAVADAAGLLGSPSLRENVSGGNYLDALLQGVGVIPGVGLLAKAGAGAKMAMALPAATKVGKAAKAAETIAEAAPEGIIAYHGSPHSFDRFDISKIGTGEGAQSYGHGLYFADNEDVAKSYRDALTDPDNVALHFRDRPVDTIWNDEISDRWKDVVEKLPNGNEEDFQTVMGNLSQINDLSQLKNIRSNLNRKQNNILDKYILPELSKPELGPGSMYQVKINANPDHFIAYDKPLSEQSEFVKKALTPGGLKLTPAGPDGPWNGKRVWVDEKGRAIGPATTGPNHPEKIFSDNENAAALYRLLGKDNPVASTERLKSAGIPGIEYLDRGSRDAKSGSHNYVVFDDKLIDVLKKYGLIGLLGGGAAAGISGQQQAQPGI